jgi:hypothetical protein
VNYIKLLHRYLSPFFARLEFLRLVLCFIRASSAHCDKGQWGLSPRGPVPCSAHRCSRRAVIAGSPPLRMRQQQAAGGGHLGPFLCRAPVRTLRCHSRLRNAPLHHVYRSQHSSRAAPAPQRRGSTPVGLFRGRRLGEAGRRHTAAGVGGGCCGRAQQLGSARQPPQNAPVALKMHDEHEARHKRLGWMARQHLLAGTLAARVRDRRTEYRQLSGQRQVSCRPMNAALSGCAALSGAYARGWTCPESRNAL